VLAVFAAENLLLGAVSALIALAVSQVASLIICRKALDMSYNPFPVESLLMVAAACLLVVCVGMTASISILRQKPVSFLREQADE
jgi:putative ABC transport system permease protein